MESKGAFRVVPLIVSAFVGAVIALTAGFAVASTAGMLTGPAGARGERGIAGEPGQIGPIGPTGRTGPIGLRGPAGSTGLPGLNMIGPQGCPLGMSQMRLSVPADNGIGIMYTQYYVICARRG